MSEPATRSADVPPGLLRRVDDSGIPLLIARLVLGGMFVYMGLAKVYEPVEFLKLIRQYHMVPAPMPWLLNGMAIMLPWVEVVCGLLLILGVTIRGAALLLLLLLTVFTVAITARAIDIYQAGNLPFCAIKFDCGCGAGEVYTCYKLPENAALWLLALIGTLSRSRRFCLGKELIPVSAQPPSPG